jgi:trehalose 6-phosphate phosphatase
MTDAAAQAMQRLRRTLPSMEGVEVEDKDPAFAVHYRQARDAGEAQDRLKAWLETLPDMLDAVWGKKVVELRPQGLTKGTAVRRIAADHPERTPVYLGDDTTDEDAFEALDAMADDDTPAPVTVKIGPEDEPTAARYRLPDPDAVVAHLQRYVEA